MMNFIRSKNDAVMDGGCLRSNISIGWGTVWHNWLFWQTGLSQHSGSSQSVRPSMKVAETYNCQTNKISTVLLLPSSLSFLSEQSCSKLMSHPRPNQPDSHQHSQSRLWFVLHWPWPLQLLGHPSKVQCLPFQPEL